MKSVFLFDNQIFDATLSASSSVLPVDNVKNPQRTKFWRSANGGTSHIDVTIASAIGIDYIALVDLNLSSGAEIRVKTYSDPGRTTLVSEYSFSPTLYINPDVVAAPYGSGAYGLGAFGANTLQNQNGNRNITIFKFPERIMQIYFRIQFIDMTGDYQQLGLMFLGQAFEFENNLSYGWQASREDRSVSRESLGGQRFVQPRDSRLRISATFRNFKDATRTRFLIRQQEFVQYKPFIFSIYPDADNKGLTTTIYCRFENSNIEERFFEQNDLSFSVIEEL